MSLFKKNPDIVFTDQGEKTPVKFQRKTNLGRRTPDLEKKKRNKKVRRTIVWSLLVIILAVGGYFGWRVYSQMNKIFASGSGNILSLINPNQTKALKGQSRGRTNILLLGIGDSGHDGQYLSDTIILMSIDYKTNSIAMFSIPRDTYVTIPGFGKSKINAADAYGEEKKKGGGPALAEQVVQNILGQPIDYYVRVSFSGLKDAVDAVGGVTVNVDNAFCDYNYPVEYKGDTSTVCFKAGPQTMNGIKALQYSRSRHSLQANEGSDFARSKRQQKVIVALKDKILSTNSAYNPKVALNLFNVLGNNVQTDFQVTDFASLFALSKKIDASHIIQKSFDNSPTGMLTSDSSTAAGYILLPTTGNWKAIQAAVANVFSTIGVTSEKATIQVLNGTWTTGLALTASADLKGQGYNVTATGDNPTKNYKKTVIIDYSGGKKPQTVAALEKYFGVTATKPSSSSTTTSTYDIQIVLGSDYASK